MPGADKPEALCPIKQGQEAKKNRQPEEKHRFQTITPRSLMISPCIAIRKESTASLRLRPDYDFVRIGRETEVDAALLIGLQGCGNVQIANLDFLAPGSASPVVGFCVNRIFDDRVAADLFLVAIAKNKGCGRKFARLFCRCLLRSARAGLL